MPAITRRNASALIASAATMVSTALNAGPAVDPIHAAIAAVADADRAWEVIHAKHTEAEERFFDARQRIAEPTHGGIVLASHQAVESYVNGLCLNTSLKIAFRRGLIANGGEGDMGDLLERFTPSEAELAKAREHDKLRETLHVEAARYEAAIEAIRRETGLDNTSEDSNRFLDYRDELAKKALTTVPTTNAGAAALARFISAELQHRDLEDVEVGLATLAAGLSRSA